MARFPTTPGSPLNMQLSGGRVYIYFLVMVALCALGVVATTIATLYLGENNFQITYQFLQIVDENLAGAYVSFISFPIPLGLAVVFLCCVEIYISYSSETEVQQTDKLFRKIAGDRLKRFIKKWFGTINNCAFALFYLAILSIVIFQGIGFAGMLGAVAKIDESIASGGGGSGSELEEQINNLQFVLFNECCASRNFTKQGEVVSCDSLADKTDCTLPEDLESFKSDLCVCHTLDASSFTEQVKAVQGSELCQRLEDAVVRISSDQKIPGTEFSITLIIPEDRARVVGFHDRPEFNPDPKAEYPIGYGCGTGFPRGMQYMFFQYSKQQTELTAFWGLGFSIAQLIILGMIFCQWANQNEEDFFKDFKLDEEASFEATPANGLGQYANSGAVIASGGVTPDFLKTGAMPDYKPKQRVSSIDLDAELPTPKHSAAQTEIDSYILDDKHV